MEGNSFIVGAPMSDRYEAEAAFMADPDRLNEHLTRVFRPFQGDKPHEVRVHPAAFSLEPNGNRVLVVSYPSPETYGGIHLTDSHENMGLGVIMGIGPTAFRSNTQSLTGMSYFPDPSLLLYRTAVYGAHNGKPIRLDFI